MHTISDLIWVKKEINIDIITTARNRPSDFYYLTNGVSAICTDYSIDENNVLEAYNFQIINGAQTVGALQAAPINRDIEVAWRVTIGKSVKTERGFNADIIKYNNSQQYNQELGFQVQ